MTEADDTATAPAKSRAGKSAFWFGLGTTAAMLAYGYFGLADLSRSDSSVLAQLLAAPLAIGAFLFIGVYLAATGAIAYLPRAAPFLGVLSRLALVVGLLCLLTLFAVVLTLEAIAPSGRGKFSMGGLELLLPAALTRFLERGFVALMALLFDALAAAAWLAVIGYFLRRRYGAAALALLVALPAFLASQTAYYARVEQRAQRDWLAWRYDARTPQDALRRGLESEPGGWESSPLLRALIAIRTPEALEAVRAYVRAYPRSSGTRNARDDLRRAGIPE